MTTTTAATAPSLPASQGLLAAGGSLLLASIFVLSGIGKIAAPGATIGYIQSAGLPFPAAALALSAAVEVIGGVALIVGFRTRLIALLLAGFSVVAAIAFHAHFGDQNQFIHFLKNFAMAGGLLQVAAFGAGSIALDKR